MDGLQQLRDFFNQNHTRSYEFRKSQLKSLKRAILQYEKELHEALYEDLKKSPEESWITETGFLIAEISHTLRKLKSWMKRERVSTNLLNFPSRSFIYKEPLGVVLIIGPWNYPLQLLLTPLVGAIAAGNCVVLKPSEFAPATAAVIKKVIDSAFSKEYIQYIEGEGAEVVPRLMTEFRFNHIFYTGSTQAGKAIYEMAASQLIPVTLELGGKSPCVVEKDANIKVAARRIAVTKFSNAGQMCVAPDYVLVHQSVKGELVQELKKAINDFYEEDPSVSYHYGRIINRKQFLRLKYYLDHGTIIYGGKYDESTLYIQPTLIENVSVHMAVMGEEIFGPVLPILGFSSYEDARKIVDHNPDPLAFYLFTDSKSIEKKWIEEYSFGGGCINNASWHLTNFNLPFGGRGNSGFGSYHGRYSFNVFSHHKSILKSPTWFDPRIKYPPFKGKLPLFKKIIK